MLAMVCSRERVEYSQTAQMSFRELSVTRWVGICAIPALICSKWEFLNWAPIPESTESAAGFLNNIDRARSEVRMVLDCGNLAYIIPQHSTGIAVITNHVEVVLFFKDAHWLDQAFGKIIKLRNGSFVWSHWTLVFCAKFELVKSPEVTLSGLTGRKANNK